MIALDFLAEDPIAVRSGNDAAWRPRPVSGSELKQCLAAILAADVAGYSRLTAESSIGQHSWQGSNTLLGITNLIG